MSFQWTISGISCSDKLSQWLLENGFHLSQEVQPSQLEAAYQAEGFEIVSRPEMHGITVRSRLAWNGVINTPTKSIAYLHRREGLLFPEHHLLIRGIPQESRFGFSIKIEAEGYEVRVDRIYVPHSYNDVYGKWAKLFEISERDLDLRIAAHCGIVPLRAAFPERVVRCCSEETYVDSDQFELPVWQQWQFGSEGCS